MSAIHLAAYLFWRMNWIHPFADGNGRTARVVSYLVLSVKLHSILPDAPTIPDLIAVDKTPYYKALEGADGSWKRGIVAVADMEAMLENMLAMQLLKATEEAALQRCIPRWLCASDALVQFLYLFEDEWLSPKRNRLADAAIGGSDRVIVHIRGRTAAVPVARSARSASTHRFVARRR